MRYAVAAVAAALLLGACSDDAAPQGSPAPSPSSSATASPSAPTLPAAARGNSPEAAEAFVRHYVDLINHANRTLQTSSLLDASGSTCEGCQAIADLYSGIDASDGEVKGGEWTINRIERPSARSGRSYVRVTYPRQVVRYETGGKPKEFPPGEALFIFEYSRRGNGFVMTQVQGPVQ